MPCELSPISTTRASPIRSSSTSRGGTPPGAGIATDATRSAGLGCAVAAAAPPTGSASNARTSSSLTWLKSQNDSPTARNGVGIDAHTTSSTMPANSRQVDSGAAGTAITIAAGSRSRSACTAAIIDDPVASPSSTTITVLPATSSGGRSPR